MKLAGFPKFALLSLAGVLALALAGCGSSNVALTQGNWSVTATSTAAARSQNLAANIFYIGGNLTQSGSAVSGSMYVSNSLCIPPSQLLAITGTVKDKSVTLTTASFQGQVITVTGTATDPSTLSGTYKVVGGACDGDQGTVAANAMPSISGTWNGLVAPVGTTSPQGITQATLSISLTQATTPSEDGTFALTGTATFTNSNCSLSGTISAGSVAGVYIPFINIDTVEQGGGPGSVQLTVAQLDSSTAPKNITGQYDVSAGLCSGNPTEFPTFTKQ